MIKIKKTGKILNKIKQNKKQRLGGNQEGKFFFFDWPYALVFKTLEYLFSLMFTSIYSPPHNYKNSSDCA